MVAIIAGEAELLHQSIVNSHQLGIVVVFEHELPGTHFRLLPQEDFGSQIPLQFLNRGPDIRVHVDLGRRGGYARTSRCQLFNLPNREPASRSSLCIAHPQR